MSEESQFRIKCSICGKDGIVRLKKKTIYGYTNKKIKQRQIRGKPKFKTKKDFDPATLEPYDIPNISINRTEHPYRFLAVLRYLFDPKSLNENKRRPVINPPKPEPRATKTSKALHDLAKAFHLLVKIQPLVEGKYPDIRAIREENETVLGDAVMKLVRLLNSAIDDRYKRSLPEWALITKEAVEKSPRAAARKYSGATPDGREVRLSIPFIREKIPEIQEFFDTYNNYEFIFLAFVGIVMKKVGQDFELLAAYRQYEKEYDQNHTKEGEIEQQLETKYKIEQPYTTEQDHHDNQLNIDKKSYEDFVIRHYDPEVRKFQKQEHERGIRTLKSCDGKIEHKVEEKDIPPDIVHKLRQHYRSKAIHAIAISPTPSRLAKIKLNDDNFSFYKRMIEITNTNVYQSLEEEKQAEILHDAYNMLVEMGWPEKMVWEKLFADIFESKLRRKYEQKGLKPDSPEFDAELDESLHKVFRSDGFRQTKLKLGLDN